MCVNCICSQRVGKVDLMRFGPDIVGGPGACSLRKYKFLGTSETLFKAFWWKFCTIINAFITTLNMNYFGCAPLTDHRFWLPPPPPFKALFVAHLHPKSHQPPSPPHKNMGGPDTVNNNLKISTAPFPKIDLK